MASSVPTTSRPLHVIPDDEESEWEYEYSSTETETFYVTLDLSKADFTPRDPVAVNTGPASYEAEKETGVFLDRRKSAGNSDAENEDDDEEQQRGPRDGKQSSSKEGKESREGEDAHRVQVLELHSPNPVISYKGRVYAGQWCQNVGTELLLTRHDSASPLPALRHLEDDVALLAASSARINVREQELKPRDGGAARNSNERREPAHAPAELVPPPDRGATQERLQQGRFLADLIALKRRRGETDEVTVIAKNVHRRKNAKKNEVEGSKGRSPRRGQPQLQYLPSSGRASTTRPRGVGKEKGGGRGVERGRARGRGGGGGGGGGGLRVLREFSLGAESIGSSTAPSWAASQDETAGSTPTPGHWDRLDEDDVPVPMQDRVGEDREEDGNGEDDEDEGPDYDSVSGSGGDDEDDYGDMDVDEE